VAAKKGVRRRRAPRWMSRMSKGWLSAMLVSPVGW
jgi:hypothetical protein